MHLSRRRFLHSVAGLWAGFSLRGVPLARASSSSVRSFHLCTNPTSLEQDPQRLLLYRDSGITDIWLAGFFYGYWPVLLDKIVAWKKRVEAAGFACHIANIPLGHPGDSLGAGTDDFPLTPPKHWRMAMRPDGSMYAGTSLHAPATEENAQALRQLRKSGFDFAFLDDDFRLATGPGVIGGCFCPEHKKAFLDKHGYQEQHWQDLLQNVANRDLTDLLRAWVEDVCDQLTESFRAQQTAAGDMQLGNMIMYLGAEKAGIRLQDYQGVPVRVGELMFDDLSFGKLKNKTAELFSSLFHRRFVSPELAFSETTAFPADRLSAANLTAKLAVSTLSDVRNTLFMSGITPFPAEHWSTLAPAMKKHAAIHEKISGHIPRGPYKHYWGEHSRYVSDDKPNSLFLATGVPFEVTDQPAKDGWTFLGDFDARAVAAKKLKTSGTTFVFRPEAGIPPENGMVVKDELGALFTLKHQLKTQWESIPYIEEDLPAVLAWYPTARAAVVWNPSEKRQSFTILYKTHRFPMEVNGLDIELASNLT